MNVVGIAVFTIVEIITLIAWLTQATGKMLGWVVQYGSGKSATATLFVGLFIEHVIQGLVKSGQAITLANFLAYARANVKGIAGFTGVETAIWIVALIIQEMRPFPLTDQTFDFAVFAFLFGTLIVKHTLAENAFAGRALLSRLLIPAVIVPSAIEAFGGAVWLAAPSIRTIIVMTVTSFIEHRMLSRPAR